MTKPPEVFRRDPSYLDSTGEVMVERMSISGPMHLTDALAILEAYEGVRGVMLHSATFSWQRPATGDEHQHYLDLQEKQRQRTERWERDMYERLVEKYGS